MKMNNDSRVETVTPTLADALRPLLPPILWRVDWPIYRAKYGVPFSQRTMSNKDVAGEGPPASRLGRRVYYERESYLNWLSKLPVARAGRQQLGADILDAGEVSLSALAASRQKKPLDTRTKLYGNWIPTPVLFHPAFLPGLSPKDFLILYTLFVYSCCGSLDEPEPVVNLRRHELQDRSGLGSGAAITTAIHRLQASGYLTADSKPGHYDISPLMSRLEELAKEKMLASLTFKDMAAREKMLGKSTKFVRKANIASSDSPAISSESRQSQQSKSTSRGGASPSPAFSNSLPSSGRKAVSSSSGDLSMKKCHLAKIRDVELTAADIPFGCSWNPMSEPAKGALVESEDILLERAEREAIREADNEAAQEREAIMADNL